jgi:hypothetical protein
MGQFTKRDYEEFNLKEEMNEGIFIQDNAPRFEALYHGKIIVYTFTYPALLKEISLWMKKSNYYPNLFYVNDHGNVDLLSLRRRGKGYTTSIIASWV